LQIEKELVRTHAQVDTSTVVQEGWFFHAWPWIQKNICTSLCLHSKVCLQWFYYSLTICWWLACGWQEI